MLNDFVLQGSYAQWSLSSVRFGDVGSLGRERSIGTPVHATVPILQPFVQVPFIFLPRQPVHSRCSFPLQGIEAVRKERHGYVVQ